MQKNFERKVRDIARHLRGLGRGADAEGTYVIFEGQSTSDVKWSVAGLAECAPVLLMGHLGCQMMHLDQANIEATPRRTRKRSRGNIATDSSGAMLRKGKILWKCRGCCSDRIVMTGVSFEAYSRGLRRSILCEHLGCANHSRFVNRGTSQLSVRRNLRRTVPRAVLDGS